ncbi:MAG: sorbosone dehydrogenase [Alphaproteobacteria bacterium]|nr:sorbosone dehydrogenase [Alphaproteobacteria bacterium]
MHTFRTIALSGAVALTLAGCGDNARLPAQAGYGASPTLPTPENPLIPFYNVPSNVGWKGSAPVAPGMTVKPFASGLTHPRWLLVLPNGDVLVSEGNHGTQWADSMGFGGWVESLVQRVSGMFVKSPDKIVLLRDADKDGAAEIRTDFISQGLNAPFGMALVGDTLYVANTDSLMAFHYTPGTTHIDGAGRKVTDLPGGPIDHHWTKNVFASADGSKLYVTIGSNSNAGENGLEAEKDRARIWEVDPKTGSHRVYASGIRNPNGLAWVNGKLWVAVNGRDENGGDTDPDYITSVQDGGFYGWPFSWYGNHVEDRIKPEQRRPDLVAKAIVPDYATGAHTSTLGLAWAGGNALGFGDGMFISQHGSWNRSPLNGYRVAFIPFMGDKPSGMPRDVLTGFLDAVNKAKGRPVGVALAKDGALLVADDTGNSVWRISK